MSELDASLLVRRTRLLLRFYPSAYRARRGEEILDTLLETTRPGRGWPPAREVASVIGGGLRARRAANLNQGLPASLRHVGILAAAMIMVQTSTALLGSVSQHIANPFRHSGLPADLELSLALGSLLVVTALALGSYRPGSDVVGRVTRSAGGYLPLPSTPESWAEASRALPVIAGHHDTSQDGHRPEKSRCEWPASDV